MAHRPDPLEIVRRDGGRALAYLLDFGFVGPELTENGIAYHRPGLHIEMCYYDWKHEREVSTSISLGGPRAFARLGCLYVACGCGPIQDIAGSAHTRLAVAKRVSQHAEGVRRVLPNLLSADVDELVLRCNGRDLPG